MSLPLREYIGSVCLLNSARTEILVDAADLPMCGKGRWTVVRGPWGGYAVKEIATVRWQLHRLVMAAQPGQVVDHINRNGLDNRRANLRFCTPTQNNANQGTRRDSKTGLKGAYWHGGSKTPWRAKIKVGGRTRSLGLFSTPEEAHAAYVRAARESFGEFARAG